MAVILKFPTEVRAAAPSTALAGASAEILFFTGVRYERGPVAKRSRQQRRPRRRPQRKSKSA